MGGLREKKKTKKKRKEGRNKRRGDSWRKEKG